jgi:hypothetical protein
MTLFCMEAIFSGVLIEWQTLYIKDELRIKVIVVLYVSVATHGHSPSRVDDLHD